MNGGNTSIRVQPRPAAAVGNTLAAIAGKDFFVKRGDMILGAVENDGGAHVDADLSPDYEHLAAVGAYRMYEAKTELPNGNVAHLPPIKDTPLIYLRQMGFEIFTSSGVQTLSASTTRGHSTRSKRRRLQLYANKSNYFADLDLHANLRLPAQNVLLERRRPVGRETLAQGILGF